MLRRGWTIVFAIALVFAAAPVFGQGTTATLNGIVQDKDGYVPGATVVLKNIGTGETYPAQITNDSGAYSFPGLAPGTYRVTITMQGFKTVEVETRLASGSTNTLPPTKLEIGARTEVIKVEGSSELVRTDTPTVSQSINSDFISTLPRVDRNALNFLVFLPGVQMTGGQAGDGARFNTSIVGLSDRNINITIDGVTTSSLLDSQGMFALITPRLDAVEEVTLTTASAGADASGQGAVQVRIVTRSGTNKYEMSGYWFQQHAALNSNTYFGRLSGLPVPVATNYTFGGRVGGPIVLPGFDGRGKAFFFFNQEELLNPFQAQRSSTLIPQTSLDGFYTYGPTGATTTLNVMTLAQTFNGGQFAAVSQYDPQVKSLLEEMRTAATTATNANINQLITSPNASTLTFLADTRNVNHAPTSSITVNASPKNRIQGSYYWIRFTRVPDNLNGGFPTYPGFPEFGNADQYRTLGSLSLRSTLNASLVNEARGGWQWAPVGFSTNGNAAQFENQGSHNITSLAGLYTAANGSSANAPNLRNTANYTMADQLNWLRGSHSMTFGADYTHINDYNTLTNPVNSLALGFTTNFDPADAIFSVANLPGSTSAERNSAKALYALLTGRVSSVAGAGRMNDAGDAYVFNGPLTRRETQDDFSFYAQDQWRWKPTLTVTAGLRYQFTLPVKSAVGNFTTMTMSDSCGPSGLGEGPGGRLCNMFNGGNPTGPGLADIRNPNVVPTYYQYDSNAKGYETDLNNLAPNVGVAWRPNVQQGFLRKVLGDPELASVSGGYTRSFARPQLDQFLNVYNGNPGQTIPATRSTTTGAFPLVLPGESWPILYTQKSRLGAPAFDPNPVFPITASFSSGAWVFNPTIQLPYTDSWNVSFQRSVTKDTVFEIRYQGNVTWGSWTIENWNDYNVYETGWMDKRDGQGSAVIGEFTLAQRNLRANVLAGHPENGFKYTGIPGTSPLPITLAHLNASTAANNPAAYTGDLWTNTTFVGALDPFAAAPRTFASNLYLSTQSSVPAGLSTRLFNNAMAVGYPSNFWVLNPLLNAVEVETNSTNQPTNHFVILSLRRRLAEGLAAQVSYTFARSFSGTLADFHLDRFYLESPGIPHAIQALWTYDLPFGRGKKYGANMSAWEDAVIGGWTFSGTARFQTQSFVLRSAVLNGMSLDEARKALSVIRFVTDPVTGAQTVFNFPEDIYTNTRLAYATDETRPTFYVPGTEPNGPLAIPTADGRYRYFAPAGGPDCSVIYPGDCGVQDLWFTGRWFGEMDFRLAKAFQLPHKARFEFSAEVFNATKALNFPNTVNPGTSGNTFRITSTQSGARTAQLVWRVSW